MTAVENTRARAGDVELARRLVREAGRLAATMRADGVTVEQKTSVSDLVTAADKAAEALVVRTLAAERPDDAILGEEGARHAGTSGRQWVIDPVDGTYNFVRGLTWWCSAVALRDGDDVLLGAVHHPHEDRTWVGGPGLGATRDETAMTALVDRPLGESCLATYLHPPFADPDVAAAFTRMAGGAASMRMLGSGTLDATAVAEGVLDVVCQHSVPAWDRLPGEALIRAVGGDARIVSAAGREWYVAGVPTAVAEIAEALGSVAPPRPRSH